MRMDSSISFLAYNFRPSLEIIDPYIEKMICTPLPLIAPPPTPQFLKPLNTYLLKGCVLKQGLTAPVNMLEVGQVYK